jgi:hypothetical protein
LKNFSEVNFGGNRNFGGNGGVKMNVNCIKKTKNLINYQKI